MMAADVVGAILLGLAMFFLYAAPLHYSGAPLWFGWLAFTGAWAVAARSQALYSKEALAASARNHSLCAASSCLHAFGCVLLFLFAFQLIGATSRVWLLTWAVSVLAWMVLLRLLWSHRMARVFRQGGCLERALVLSGSPALARRVSRDIERESGGYIHVTSTDGLPGIRDQRAIAAIEAIARSGEIDRVIITGLDQAVASAQLLLDRLKHVAVEVTLIPSLDGLKTSALKVHSIGTLPAIDLSSHPLSPVQAALKRAEDLVLGSLILLVTLPVFLLVSAAIKLDSRGPVFFRQKREGYNGSTFKVWKFRTMYQAVRDEGSVRQTARNDLRVTRVGRLLRRLSVDELPQIINVLHGEMSIVGPRPHALSMTSVGVPMHEVIDWYPARHRLKPGITGLAQISGCRGEIDSHEKLHRRVSLDCEYINRWSLSLDLWIILRTVVLVMSDPDAY
jgi:Undecaprenyl-phosphate glucose phosphotransferase